MRTPTLLAVPLTALMLASLCAAAQDAPRVIFCTGQCFAVDEKGVRVPAPKGTQLLPGQRVETGPNSYAQLKIGQGIALGIGESARVNFGSPGVRDRDVVTLETGRIRMLDGNAVGKALGRPLELRTADGIFALRSADIEIKAPPPVVGGEPPQFTVVKLNVGEAQMLVPQGAIALRTDIAQGFTRGTLVTDKVISLADVAPTPIRTGTTTSVPTFSEPVRLPSNLPTLSPVTAPTLRTDLLQPTTTFISSPLLLAPPPVVVSGGDRTLLTPVIDASTGTRTTLTTLVTQPPPPTSTSTSLTSTPIRSTIILFQPVTTTTRTTTFTTTTK